MSICSGADRRRRDRVQLEMSLTPGVAVADSVVAAIDADRNGNLSQQEQDAYAAQVVNARRCPSTGAPHRGARASTFPDAASLRSGDGAITIRATRTSRDWGPAHIAFVPNTRGHECTPNALVPEHDDVTAVWAGTDAISAS